MLDIRQRALKRIAWVFNTQVSHLNPAMNLTTDFPVKKPSLFAENELDKIGYDIQEAQEKLGVWGTYEMTVHTIGDYCMLMERYYAHDPKECVKMFCAWNREVRMSNAKRWRRTIYSIFGI